jgi:hypothetical protein
MLGVQQVRLAGRVNVAPQLTARPLDAFVASSARIIYYLFIFSRERVVFKFFLGLRDERRRSSRS